MQIVAMSIFYEFEMENYMKRFVVIIILLIIFSGLAAPVYGLSNEQSIAIQKLLDDA